MVIKIISTNGDLRAIEAAKVALRRDPGRYIVSGEDKLVAGAVLKVTTWWEYPDGEDQPVEGVVMAQVESI